jgi:hypothetical protein
VKSWPHWALWPFVMLAVAAPALYGAWRVIADPTKIEINAYPIQSWLYLILNALATFLGILALSYIFNRPAVWPWVAIGYGVLTATRGLIEASVESWNTETLGDVAVALGSTLAGVLMLVRASAEKRKALAAQTAATALSTASTASATLATPRTNPNPNQTTGTTTR